MEYSVDEVPAASWGPGLEQALACYRIVHEVAGTVLETPDAMERDERNAHEITHMLNSYSVLVRALKDIHAVSTANMPPSERLADTERWALAALEYAECKS
jgi:aminoglycoside phosphotransferase (APT) family kinase protein